MRLMRLGRLLSFMSSRARVLPPASLTAAIESLPAAPDSVAALGRVRAALDDDDGVDTDEQLAAAAAAAATALERAAHRHGKRGWTTLRDAARPAATSPAAACGLGAALALWRDRRQNTTAPHGAPFIGTTTVSVNTTFNSSLFGGPGLEVPPQNVPFTYYDKSRPPVVEALHPSCLRKRSKLLNSRCQRTTKSHSQCANG